jgi:hypothetical protein
VARWGAPSEGFFFVILSCSCLGLGDAFGFMAFRVIYPPVSLSDLLVASFDPLGWEGNPKVRVLSCNGVEVCGGGGWWDGFWMGE